MGKESSDGVPFKAVVSHHGVGVIRNHIVVVS